MEASWIKLGAEGVLVLAVVLLYLNDSLLLLTDDEALLLRVRGSDWRAAFGARQWKLSGREPYLANPFTPHRPVYRLRWRMAGSAGALRNARAVPDGFSDALSPSAAAPLQRLAPLVWAVWSLLFVAVPYLMLVRRDIFGLLAAVSALYVVVVAMLVLVWRQRLVLGLDGRRVALIGFECLACVPYAANLVRRLAWAQAPTEDFTAAAQRLLDPLRRANAWRQCLVRIDERLDAEPEQGAAAAALRSARQRFEEVEAGPG